MVLRELITLLGFKVDDKGQKEYNKDIDQTKTKQESLTAAFLKAQVIAAAAQKVIGGAISYFKDTIISGTIEMQGYQTELEMMSGSADEAAATLARLRDNTVDPLFGTGNLVNAYKGLRTIGMEGAAAEKMVTTLGDMANGSAENFNSLAQILQKTAATGKFGSMQMNQLAQAGYGAADMAKDLGMSEVQLRIALDEGKIGFNELSKAMAVATSEGGKFFGNAERHANTLNGRIKILQDLIASTGDAIGTAVLPELTGFLKYVTELAKAGQETFIGVFVKVIKEVIHWIFQIMITWEILQYRIEDAGAAFDPLLEFIKALAQAVGTAMGGIFPFLVKFALLIMAIATNIGRFLTPIIKEVGEIVRDVFSMLAQLFDPIISAVNKSGGAFQNLGTFIAGILRPVLIVTAGVKGLLLVIGGIKAVIGGITAVSTAFKLLTGSMSVMKAAAEGNKLAMIMLDAQMLKSKAITLAKTAAEKIAALATKAWSVVQMAFNAVMSANPIALIIIAVIALVAAAILLIKNWDKVKAFFIALGKKIAEIFTAVVGKIKQIFSAVIQWIIGVWSTIADFFSSLWNGIVEATRFLWEPLVSWFTGLIDNIKAIWNGIIGFFTGLWEAIMQGPAAVIEFIRSAFTSLFDGIQEKLFGFINKVKEGWDKVTGFFGNAVSGVVNFFTGGEEDIKKNAPTKVNDMILTPEGQFQTSPDDYIMAMKDPASLIDAVMRFLGQGLGMPEPALAGGMGDSLLGGAMMQAAAAPTNYNNSSSNYSESIQAPITVNVNASGMTPDQAESAVKRGVEDGLKNAINSSRGNIPRPEVERY